MTETHVSFAHDWKPGYRPSNGTEGEYFRAAWCDRCEHDHDMHNADGEGPGCLIFCSSIAGEYSYPAPNGPPEWEITRNTAGDSLTRCTAFQSCKSCEDFKSAEHERFWPPGPIGAWKPKPVTHIEGQERLL